MRASRVVAGARFCMVLLAGCVAGPASDPPGADGDPRMNSGQTADTLDEQPLDVRLEAVSGVRPESETAPRNPFRFGLAPAPIDADPPVSEPEPVRDTPPRPPPSGATSAVVALKFVGVVEAPESAGRVAVLTDGVDVYHGRVDDIIEGRYRIVTIGVMSIEIEHLQGGGRQTIRLNGS